MAVATEKIKSIVVTEDTPFKSSVNRVFNDIAYAGEKFQMTEADLIKQLLKRDKMVKNIVIDVALFEGQKVVAFLKKIEREIQELGLKVLVYVPKERMKFVEPAMTEQFPKVFLKEMPIKKGDFIEVFHKKLGTQTWYAAGQKQE